MSRSASNYPPASLLNGSLPAVSADVAIGDWEELLSAVKSRLRLTVGELLAVLPKHESPDAAHRVQASVLECVNALDQLHLTLSHELARRQQLEREAVETQAVLARARDQLTATWAGEQHARHLASHDGPTALPSRSSFHGRLELALDDPERRRRGLALVYLGLDGFKAINDEHGSEAGAELLRIVAARLVRGVRADDLVSRVGDDEFACLLADVPSREQLSHLACKMYYAASAPMKIGQARMSVHASIGLAICPVAGASAKALLEGAANAMARARWQNTRYAFSAEGAATDAGTFT